MNNRSQRSIITINQQTHRARYTLVTAWKVTAASPGSLSKAIIKVRINGHRAEALIDTGSSESFVNSSLARDRKWKIYPTDNTVCIASTSLQSSARGYCNVELDIKGYTYRDVKVRVLRDLCADVFLGHNVLKQHTSVEIPFGGKKTSSNSKCADHR